MARPKARGHKTEPVNATAQPCDSKLSAHEISRNDNRTKLRVVAAIKRPMKDIVHGQKTQKVKNIVSTAGVFKKAKVEAKARRQHRRKTPTPEPAPNPDLSEDFREGVEEARDSIGSNLEASFAEVHSTFLTRLVDVRVKDEAFIKSSSATTETLGAPLAEEQIETTFTRDGERVTEIVEIGKRILQFKKSVEKESARLGEYWAQWDELQNDFVELGVEVFGPNAFPDHGVENIKTDKGFKKELELLDLDHASRVDELTAEVDDITSKILKKMKTAEKELDTISKREQAKLLQAIIRD